MKIFRFFGLLFLVFGILIVSFTYEDVLPFFSKSDSGILKALWKEDIENLIAAGKMPDAYFSIREIEVMKTDTPESAQLLKEAQPRFMTIPQGQNRLRIFLDAWEAQDIRKKGVLVQLQLVDLKSGNTIWELSRTYPLGDL